MGRYRKKPVVIEAVQFTGSNLVEVRDFLRENEKDKVYSPAGYPLLLIHTLEGVMEASPGDFIIRGVKGELYPVKPDIFADTYDPVEVGQ